MTGTDLITRLRALADGQHDVLTFSDLSVGAEAADEIERLTDELKRVRAAERARCIRAIKNTVVKIWQADWAMRAIAAILALEDTP